jgi:STE24 endopeptidase
LVELAEQAGERTSRKEIVGVCIMGLLIGLAIALASLPALTAVSRRWERAADRYSLELTTGDRTAYETAFRRLARTNLADLDPPWLLYLLLFTHPTPPERLEAAG